MKTATKKSKEIQKEIKVKVATAIEGVLIKINKESSEKIQKTIKNASSEIVKKFLKAVKKNEKKVLKVKDKTDKKAKATIVKPAAKKATKNKSF